jgi:hypothetical protein
VQPDWPEHARAAGRWYLILERDEYMTNDLPDLERKLWEFAKSAGYFEEALRGLCYPHCRREIVESETL